MKSIVGMFQGFSDLGKDIIIISKQSFLWTISLHYHGKEIPKYMFQKWVTTQVKKKKIFYKLLDQMLRLSWSDFYKIQASEEKNYNF